MRQAIACVAVLTGIGLALTEHATAQILDIGPRETMDLEGVHTFDEVIIRGGTLNFTGDTTLRVLGDFQVLNEPGIPGDEESRGSRGFLGIDEGIRGTRGAFGACCDDGANGNSIVPNGQAGGPGGNGGDGTDGVSHVNTVRINAGGDILIDGSVGSGRVLGGIAGSGGEGGNGGNGLDRQFSGIASGPGGDGGPGAGGGGGGNAGQPEAPLDVILNALGMITFGPDAQMTLGGTRGANIGGAHGGGADEGGDGGRGGNATLGSAFNGGDGARGGVGGDGGDGGDGARGGDIYMMAPTIHLLNARTDSLGREFLFFTMLGGGGGFANDGGLGGPGGSGGDAGSFAGNGGFGGDGGTGGDGGDGGDGARGGNLILRGVDVMLAFEALNSQRGGLGGSAGSGGDGEGGGFGGLGGTDFRVEAPNGLNGGAGSDGQPGADAADGVIDIAVLDAGGGFGIGNGGFSNGLAFFVELGEGTASIVQINDDPALQMDVDVGALSLTQIVGTDGAGGLQVDLDYAFVTPAGTLEVRFDGNLILSITPTGVTSPEATPTVTPGAPFNHVSAICPVPVVAGSFHELSLRALPGSPATIQVDNLALQLAAVAVEGDIDGDGDVDLDDINLILAARNQPATGAGDPRDLDGDGVITVLDARIAATMCTRPRCATA